jgi:ubiquitin C-terminal hydrolase
MNSILQLFLNNQEIKDIFLKEGREEELKFYDFIINKKKANGELILEFINLLKEKYIKNKKTITPKRFKEICGQYNETFKNFEQQDAHDFYTFLVDNLHEDTNIKSNSNRNQIKEESDTIDTTEIELSNEYWANSIRSNASYIYGLFFGQLKSTLTCNECKKNKLKYENFSALELPIPEGGKIIIEIILFRLPCTLSPFYKFENNENNNNNYSNNSEKRALLNDMNKLKKSNSKPKNKNINDENFNINNEEKELKNDCTVSKNRNIRKKLKKIKNYRIGK